MTIIRLTFPWGRYYAHPWGINPTRLRESEWPPSPWRLLRALISAWFQAYPGRVPSTECIELIEALGRELPDIGVGKVTFGHTVHWQPNYGATEDKQGDNYKRTRHENHFAAVSTPIHFRWQSVNLSVEQRQLLQQLLREIAYFGRSEALCEATLCESLPDEREIGWCTDTGGRKISATCRDVFCPNPADFRLSDLWSRRPKAGTPEPDSSNAPQHLVDQLLSSNMQVDGAVWRSYQMPSGWPHRWIVRTPRTVRPATKPAPTLGPKVARYLCFSLECRVPLLPKFAVPLSETFRGAANSKLCKVYGDETSSFALLGHDRPPDAEGDHQHAFYLPMARQGDRNGFLSDLHIWCPYGFTQAEIEILLRIDTLYWGSGAYPVRPVLTALAKESPLDAPFSTGSISSRLWRSASPFVPPRYFYRGSGAKAKLKEKDRPEMQLAECIRVAGLQVPGEIRRYQDFNGSTEDGEPRWEIVRAEVGEETAAGAPFVNVSTHRNGSSSRRGMERRIGGFFEIEFEEPVAIKQPALGHSCHFGLGIFVPANS